MSAKKNKFEITVFIIVFVIACFTWITRYFNKKEVLGDYSKTTGWIIDYYMIGEHHTRYLTYEYEVQGITYTRKINPEIYFDFCAKNIRLCSDKRFWV